MAAVSLALKWSPPASTSLFDDVADATPGSSSSDSAAGAAPAPAPGTTTSATPSTSTSTTTASSSPGRRPSASSTSPAMVSSTSSSSSLGVPVPTRSLSASPPSTQVKSYAAAASSAASSSVSSFTSSSPPASATIATATEAPRPGASTAGAQPGDLSDSAPQVGQSVFFPTATANTVSWQQYQQMVSQARQQSNNTGTEASNSASTGAGTSRRRTASGPQRAPVSFNDAHTQHPVPPLSYASSTIPSHLRPDGPAMVHSNSSPAIVSAAATAAAAAGGYHPYRRTPRSSSTSPSGVPVLPQIQFGSMLDSTDSSLHLSPPANGGPRRGSASSASGAPGPPPLSYSSVAAGALRGASTTTSSPPAPAPAAPGSLAASLSSIGAPPASPTQAESFTPRDSQSRRPSDASSITTPGTPMNYTHIRNMSFSSQFSTNTERERPGVIASPSGQSTPKTSSPLSQQASSGLSTAQIGAQKKSLPSRLRKAISLSTMSEFGSAGEGKNSNSKSPARTGEAQRIDSHGGSVVIEGQSTDSPPMTPDRNGLGSSAASISSRRSGRPPVAGSGEGGTKRSLFNRKFNASTDNISISSTVSSASVMLRKMGNLGKLARRHSLMGLTNMFKDKDRGGPDGREGFHTDDFGTMTSSGASTDGIENNSAQAGGKVKRGKAKKAAPVAASITHATVELETGGGAMTPAASYVRQHQLQMRQQIEQASTALPPQTPGLLSRVRNMGNDSSSPANQAAANSAAANLTAASSGENRNQKMFDREKERLKKQRGWKKMLPGGGGSSGSAEGSAAQAKAAQQPQPTGLETYAASDEEQAPGYGSVMNSSAYTMSSSSSSRAGWNTGGASAAVAGALPNSAAALYGEPAQDGMYDEDDDDDLLEPPHAPYADGAGESGDEYETDSLRHWGEGIERSRASAAQIKSVKGILRKQSAYGPDPANERGPGGGHGHARSATFGGLGNAGPRVRSSSFDATQGPGAPGVPLMSQMSNTTEGVDRMDGLATARAESPSSSTNLASANGRAESPSTKHAADAGPITSPPLASPTAGVGATTNLGHHSNSSMPTLSLMLESPSGRPGGGGGVARSANKKRLVFAESHIFHSTWPAHVYDRRGELATCNRLTPALAQSIKEELNSYKMEEMVVAPSSRIYTHFFV